MSVQKITNNELLTYGVKGLPTRPSTPSLYKGSTLSAEELKEAFDKLPRLIAERFNALLESTGLYDESNPADSLAALIATDLGASHSLLDFFADVKNGGLALYLTAGEDGEPLADVLSELRRLIEAKKSYTVSIEGDGDLVTEASLTGDHLTIKHGAKMGDLLDEARSYAENPTGSIRAECTKPVSGGEIYESIETLKDAHDKRITNLENAANDILYTYPTEEATFAHRRMTADTLAHTALLQLAAAPQEHVNLFPEQMLFDFKNENLTITWDDEEKALVINGTLHATESPLVLFSYHLEIPDFRLSFGAFYRGGSVSTQSAKLHIVSNNYSYVDIGLLTEDVTFSKPRSVLGGRFYSIELMADEDTVFENYRFNVLVSREQSFIRYTPFDTRNHFSFPRKLVALGPNVWNGEEKLCGETYVSFTPPSLPGVYTYALGFSGISSHPETPPLLINFYTEDGFVLEKDLDPGIFHTTTYVSEKPITEIRVYAAETEEDSVGYQVQIEKIYVEPVPTKQKGTREYSPYHRDEIVFPETFSRFADDFVGDGVTYFNYFDFEDGMYYKKCNTFSIDGSLDFQVDETASGTVFAPISLLTETQEKNLAFQASGVFMKAVNTYHSERVWFENGCFYCHSKLFTGKTAEQVKRFFSLCPVDISWEKKSEKYSLTIEEKALLTAPTICLAPNAYLYFADEEGNPVNARSVMQYQIKQTMEATE